MAKYEIMSIIDGKLDDKNANIINDNLLKILKNVDNLKVTSWGNKELAYPINKRTMGYYYIYEFSTTDSDVIREFRRLTNINKDVLRYLIINKEKDYGARALNNEKKVKKSNRLLQKYEAIQAKRKQEFAAQGGATSLNKKRSWTKKTDNKEVKSEEN